MDQPQESADLLHNLQYSMLEALFDTFVRYLHLPAIIPHIPNIDKVEDTQQLLHWVLDEDDENRSHLFVKALKEANKKGTTVLRDQREGKKINEYVDMLVQALDGRLLQRLTPNDVLFISNSMVEEKFISQRQHADLCKQIAADNSQLICTEMFGMIKRGKADWPFEFLEALKSVRPDLCVGCSDGTIGLSHEQDQPGFSSALSDLPDAIANLPRSLDDTDQIRSCYPRRLHITQDELNTSLMKEILRRGVITEDRICVDQDLVYQDRNESLHDASFSDGEEKSETEENEKGAQCSGTPSLHLRQYQLELSQTALTGQNTIICAPTGSGKTRVSTYIILKHLESDENKERKVAFLARTVPLVQQQCNSLKKHLPSHYQIGQVTGDSEHRGDVKFLLPSNDVTVMTPKVLENHINKEALKLGNFTLLIFDECHHTRKDEPYNNLMFVYLKTKKEKPSEKLPQIVGLTASIGIEKACVPKVAVVNILKVCGNLDCDNISMVHEHREELRRTVPVPDEEIKSLRERDRNDSVMAIEKTMTKLEEHVKQHAQDLNNEEFTKLAQGIPGSKKSQQYNQWAVKLKSEAKSTPIYEKDKETNMSVRCLIILANYLKEFNVALEAHDLVQLADVMQYLEKCFQKYRENEKRTKGETLFYQHFEDLKEVLKNRHYGENENLTILAKTLQNYLTSRGDKSCGIVFVRTRALSYALTSWLKRCGIEELQNLNASMFTGAGAKADQLGMTQADQESVIEQFREGTTRLLVATTVAEEGLDIPECNLVIKYNHVGNEVTTVQTRGRSRKQGGISILLAMEKVATKERVNQGKAKLMNEALEIIRVMPRAEIKHKNLQHQDQLIAEAEIKMLLNQQAKKKLKNIKFTMVCGLCRKLAIQSEDIKTIESVHRVAIDSSLWNKNKVKIFGYSEPWQVDDVKMLGSVRCMMEPEPGKHCFNHLGSMILYSNTPFINLGMKNFSFHIGNTEGLQSFKKWKDVPYKVDALTATDLKRYFDNMKSESDNDVETEEDSGFSRNTPEETGLESQSEADKTESTEAKRLELPENDEETQMKQLQERPVQDSGLYSQASQSNSSRSNDETFVKQVVPTVQQVPDQSQESASVSTMALFPESLRIASLQASLNKAKENAQNPSSERQLGRNIDQPIVMPAASFQLETYQARGPAQLDSIRYLTSNAEMPPLQISESSSDAAVVSQLCEPALRISGAEMSPHNVQSSSEADEGNCSNTNHPDESIESNRRNNRPLQNQQNDLNVVNMNENLERNNFADDRNVQNEERSAGSRESNATSSSQGRVFNLL